MASFVQKLCRHHRPPAHVDQQPMAMDVFSLVGTNSVDQELMSAGSRKSLMERALFETPVKDDRPLNEEDRWVDLDL